MCDLFEFVYCFMLYLEIFCFFYCVGHRTGGGWQTHQCHCSGTVQREHPGCEWQPPVIQKCTLHCYCGRDGGSDICCTDSWPPDWSQWSRWGQQQSVQSTLPWSWIYFVFVICFYLNPEAYPPVVQVQSIRWEVCVCDRCQWPLSCWQPHSIFIFRGF